MNVFERKRLQDDHRRLDQEIAQRLQRRWTDPIELQQLKKQKLAIKDLLHRVACLDPSAPQSASATQAA
ncbi:MAG: YdcH family protein [Rhizobiales bacterium]|nr:YdcH family protein [Hyphomicrobiales bacterium]